MSILRSSKYVNETGIPIRTCSITWKIRHFSSFRSTGENPMLSSKFSSDFDETWQLKAYGTRYSYLIFDLIPIALKTQKTNAYTEFAVLISGQKYLVQYLRITAATNSSHSVWAPNMDELVKLLKKHNDDDLTIICKIDILEEEAKLIAASTFNTEMKPPHSLNSSLRKFLTNQAYSDVTLQVKEKVFKSHRIILAANSPVFEAMFQEGTKEHQNNRVVIQDIDTDVFESFLHFFYTGEALHLEEMVSELFVAADKYNVQPLREICIEHMSKNLSVDNATSILILADRHSLDTIKLSVIKFIQKHFMDVAMTGDWISLTNNCPQLLKEVRDAILSKR